MNKYFDELTEKEKNQQHPAELICKQCKLKYFDVFDTSHCLCEKCYENLRHDCMLGD